MKKKIALGLLAILAAVMLVAYDAHQAFARPESSPDPNNCTPCHTDGRTAGSIKNTNNTTKTTSKTSTTKKVKTYHKGNWSYNHQLEVLQKGNTACSKCHKVDFCVSCHITKAKPTSWDTKHSKLNSKSVNIEKLSCKTCHKDFKKKKP